MLVLKDFSTSILAAPLSDTAMSVVVGDAGRFPSLSAGSYFYAVLQKFSDRHQVEIVKVIGVSGNTLTLERAQAGTVAKQFTAGDYIELRLTVATFDEYIRQSVVGKVDSVDGVVRQTLSFENAGDGVRSSFGVRFSDHHETVIGGAAGLNAVSPSLHLRPLGKDNKSVEATYTSDGVFSLFGGAATVAARKLVLSSPDSAGWPNGVAASADNYARQWRSVVQANNSSLYLVGDGTLNARRFGFQVGNADPALAHEVGVLELNPHGGDVRVNGGVVYHTNYRPTPAAIGAMPVQGSVNFDWTGIGSLFPSHFYHHVFSDSDPSVYVHAYTGLAGASNTSYRIRTNNADISSYDEHLFDKNGAYFNGQRYFHEGFLPSLSALGAYPLKGGQLKGHMLAKSYVIAESPDGLNWVGIEAADGDKPYISAKVNNVAKRVIEFNSDGSASVLSNLRVDGEVRGVAFSTVGGQIRSNNASVVSLDGKIYSYVTSPFDAHLCQNSYWDGVDWRKYDVNAASGYLAIINGALKFNTSDAGVVSPRQRLESVYHTGHKPNAYDVGAVPANRANGTPVAAYYIGSAIDKTGTKIRLPFNVTSLKMVSFTVRVYQEYQSHDIQFSGYLYDVVNNWYAPRAIMIAGSAPVLYAMGRDDDGRAYVWIGGASYRGVGVFDVVGGFNQADWNTGWEISVSDHKPNLAMEGGVHPPYSPANKPSSEELNVIGINKKNYLNNADNLGVGFIAAGVAGAGWIATYHGSDAGDKVVMGSLSGKSTIASHTPDCTDWADLYINTQAGLAGIRNSTVIGNPYAKNTDDNAVYRVYHQGFKPNAHEIGAAPAGFGVGDYGAMISTVLGDCNLRRQGGFFRGPQMDGLPSDGNAWKYVINVCHDYHTGYFGYIAFDFDLDHAWLGGQSGGVQKPNKKFVFQNDRIVTGGAVGNDFTQGSIEVNGNGGDAKPTIGFHQMGQFAASISLWSGSEFRFHTQGLTDYAGITVGLANVSDVYIRSDVRLKTNFVEMRGALDKLSLLQAYYYDKKGMLSSEDYSTHELGLKAQDVEAVEPVAVRRVEDSSGGEILSISGSAINAMLVQAINELRIRVEELEINARS